MSLCYKLTDPSTVMVDGSTDYTDCYMDIRTFYGGVVMGFNGA